MSSEGEAVSVSRTAILADFDSDFTEEVATKIAEAIWAWGRGIAAVAIVRGASSEEIEEAIKSAVRGLEALITRR